MPQEDLAKPRLLAIPRSTARWTIAERFWIIRAKSACRSH
jgi:hypothetical protein